MSPDTPIWQLTVGQFQELIKKTLPEKREVELVHGLKGLMELIGCGETTASRILNSGDIDEAVTRYNRQIIIDKHKALELLKNKEL